MPNGQYSGQQRGEKTFSRNISCGNSFTNCFTILDYTHPYQHSLGARVNLKGVK